MLSTTARRPLVGIVGGGASGALAALALLRQDAGLDVVIIEPRAQLGRGIAYSTPDPAHRLNVPAASMSAIPGDPQHFQRWAEAYHGRVTGFSFPTRALYGRYLTAVLDAAAATRPGALAHLRGRASSVRSRPGGWGITLAEGGSLTVDALVLAAGYGPPAGPAGLPVQLAEDPRFVRDPWADGAFPYAPSGGRVLLIGTGLTAVDVALTLTRRDAGARFTAVSRHGLRPLDHRVAGAPGDPPVTAAVRPRTALGLLRSVRAEAALSVACGGDWRDAVNHLRPLTNDLWQALPLTERHRFVHRLSRFWEVHRHRLAPVVSAAAGELEADGRLQFVAGRVVSAEARPDGLRIGLELPGGSRRRLDVGLAVNCTGLTANVGSHPLLGRMEADGMCAPGPLGLGIATTESGEVLDRRGRPGGMFALGPLRRGELWETTAIPEIRDQAFSLAAELVSRLQTQAVTARRRPA